MTTTVNSHRQSTGASPRIKQVTWHDPLDTARVATTLSGLDFLESIQRGQTPPPPIAALLNFEIVEVQKGRVVFTCTIDESVYNPIGMVHGGLVCTLADTVIGCAVHSTLEAGVGYSSIDLSVSYLRPVSLTSGPLRATGDVTKVGQRVGFAAASITDVNDRVVATATGSCIIQ